MLMVASQQVNYIWRRRSKLQRRRRRRQHSYYVEEKDMDHA